ncbi:YwiC-like family protein [Mobilicoccus caccae]|nr:YwiC-like family protein [Mobilicoccus caccae]
MKAADEAPTGARRAAAAARPPTGARRGGKRGSARAAWVPKQHGAWAMLVVPFLVGAVHAGLAPTHLPLLICWIVGYLCFAATGLWLRSRRKPVYLRPMLTYGGICLAAGLVLLALQPSLLVWAPVFAPLGGISLWYSWRRDDRALGNDIVTILAASLMTLVAASAGRLGSVTTALTDPPLLGMTLAVALYFVGTSLYVKTLIRERRSRGYKHASIAYHAAATALWLILPWLLPESLRPPALTQGLLVAFFAVTTARAAVLAGRAIRPMKVGLGEIALSTVLTLILLLTW